MNRTAAPAIALAACVFALPQVLGADRRIDIQLTPAGAFVPSDGREMRVPHWYIDAAVASRVIARQQARRNPLVLDYEHQTLNKESNGQPAPAAGWMLALEWREGSGLWATAELTERAAAHVQAGEYRYISPVFQYDPATGSVLAIEMAALTNTPAIDGMAALTARATATFCHITTDDEETPMNKLLAAIVAALGLPESTTEDAAIAACSALKPRLEALEQIEADLGAADATAAVAACSALRKQANAVPDPAKYVPVGVVEEMRGQLAALSAQHTERQVNELVEAGLADGRLLPAQKQWAQDLGKTNLAALNQYLQTAQPIAALSHTQTGGQAPASEAGPALTEAERAVCSATGITPEQFVAARAAKE